MKNFEKVKIGKFEKNWRNQISCNGTATERWCLAHFMTNRQKQFILEIFDPKWSFFRKKRQNRVQKYKILNEKQIFSKNASRNK